MTWIDIMDNIKELKFLYVCGNGGMRKVEITKHTEKSVMIGSTRLQINNLTNGEWYVRSNRRWVLGTYYKIPTTELDEQYSKQLKLYKVDSFLRGITAEKLLETNPQMFESILSIATVKSGQETE